MSIVLEKNNFTITDNKGVVKFSLNNRMPHIINDISGTIEIPRVFKTGVPLNTQSIDREDLVTTISNSYISVNVEDSFILPFYKITGGYSDTNNLIVSGTGSVLLRRIVQATTREYLGGSILNLIQENQELKLICNQHLDRSGYTNIEGDDVVNVSYRIYYGRFK